MAPASNRRVTSNDREQAHADRRLLLLMFRWRVMLSIFYVVFDRLVGVVDCRTKPLRVGRLAHHRFLPRQPYISATFSGALGYMAALASAEKTGASQSDHPACPS
jgi:hypothetical protein